MKSINSSLSSLNTNSFLELQEWCRDYDRLNKHPTDFFVRFAIGFYQIYQGIEWKDETNKNESFAAACIHLIIVAEKLELSLEQHIENNIACIFYNGLNYQNLLKNWSKAQQHVFYAYKQGTQRSKRYNPEILTKLIASIVNALFGCILPDHRDYAIEDATTIMTKKL